jgi:hypothetical protein
MMGKTKDNLKKLAAYVGLPIGGGAIGVAAGLGMYEAATRMGDVASYIGDSAPATIATITGAVGLALGTAFSIAYGVKENKKQKTLEAELATKETELANKQTELANEQAGYNTAANAAQTAKDLVVYNKKVDARLKESGFKRTDLPTDYVPTSGDSKGRNVDLRSGLIVYPQSVELWFQDQAEVVQANKVKATNDRRKTYADGRKAKIYGMNQTFSDDEKAKKTKMPHESTDDGLYFEYHVKGDEETTDAARIKANAENSGLVAILLDDALKTSKMLVEREPKGTTGEIKVRNGMYPGEVPVGFEYVNNEERSIDTVIKAELTRPDGQKKAFYFTDATGNQDGSITTGWYVPSAKASDCITAKKVRARDYATFKLAGRKLYDNKPAEDGNVGERTTIGPDTDADILWDGPKVEGAPDASEPAVTDKPAADEDILTDMIPKKEIPVADYVASAKK